MTLRRMLLGLSALSLIVLPLTVGPASAQAKYPSKSVHWIVGYVPGGTTDILARLMGQYLSEKTGQQFIIENKAGAGNNLAVEAVLAAPADGYTLLLVNPANGINATLYKKLSFNFVKDIAPVGGLMRVPNVMVVNNNVPAKTVKEFIDHVKANPGKVNLASSGNGTSVHMSGELFMEMTGAKMTHVPYRGSNPALTDIMGGQVQVLFDNMPSSIELIKGGKIRALGVTTEKRASYFPDLPTVAETVPGYEASAWFGIGAPRNTPPDVIATINREVNAGLADAKIKAKLADLGGTIIPGSPADFGRLIASEIEKWAKVIKFANIKPE
jgi:tripartite-type tricarboxylate transporter receptor subunit TctC